MTRSAIVAILCALLAPTGSADDIHLVRGSRIRNVTVIRATYYGIKWKLGAARGEYTPSKVSALWIGGTPASFDRGMAAAKAFRHAETIEAMNKVLEDAPNMVWVPQACLWRIAQAQLALGDRRAARKTLGRLINLYPEGLYLPDARAELGRLELEARRVRDAKDQFTALSKLCEGRKGRSLVRSWRHVAQIGAARCAIAPGFKAGLATLRKMRVDNRKARQDIYLAATMAEARALVGTDTPTARLLFEDVAKLAPQHDPSLLPAAKAGSGECSFHLGHLKKAHAQLDAVIALGPAAGRELPRALYFRMRSHSLNNDKAAAEKVGARLRKQFPNFVAPK